MKGQTKSTNHGCRWRPTDLAISTGFGTLWGGQGAGISPYLVPHLLRHGQPRGEPSSNRTGLSRGHPSNCKDRHFSHEAVLLIGTVYTIINCIVRMCDSRDRNKMTTSLYFFRIGIIKTQQAKKEQRSNSLKRLINNSYSGQNATDIAMIGIVPCSLVLLEKCPTSKLHDR